MSQRELAARTGLSTAYICELEKGKAQPSLDSARKLAAVFGVSIEEAFDVVEVPA